jgi:hypothetical protein
MRVTLKSENGTLIDLHIWNLVMLHMLNSGTSDQYSLAGDVSACVLTVDGASVPYPYTSEEDDD